MEKLYQVEICWIEKIRIERVRSSKSERGWVRFIKKEDVLKVNRFRFG